MNGHLRSGRSRITVKIKRFDDPTVVPVTLDYSANE